MFATIQGRAAKAALQAPQHRLGNTLDSRIAVTFMKSEISESVV
jgi:hypothetical protein